MVEQEELRNQRNETLRRVFEFAGVDPGFSAPGFATQRHRRPASGAARPSPGLLDRVDRRRGTVSARRFRALAGAVFPVGRSIEVPDVRGALPDETLRSLREDAEKLRDLTGLDLSDLVHLERLMSKDKTPEERQRRKKARAAKSQALKPEHHEHSHPGGAARPRSAPTCAKFSSFQGLSLLLTNILHYSSLIVVARMLGPGALGSYALLFFLTGAGHAADPHPLQARDDDADLRRSPTTTPTTSRRTRRRTSGGVPSHLHAGRRPGLDPDPRASAIIIPVAIFQTQIAAVPAARPEPGIGGHLRDDHRTPSGRSSSSPRW